jgi:hypothetical protein
MNKETPALAGASFMGAAGFEPPSPAPPLLATEPLPELALVRHGTGLGAVIAAALAQRRRCRNPAELKSQIRDQQSCAGDRSLVTRQLRC